MRLLVTGGAGFIGSQLLRHLVTSYPSYTIVCVDSLTLSDSATVLYKVDQYYNKPYERGIHPHSESLSIDWQVSDALLSEKDQTLTDFKDFKSPF